MRYVSIILLSFLLLTAACSNSDEKPEKNGVETAQERIGREAADQIKATMQSAEKARDLQNQHTRQIEAATEANSTEK